MCQMISEKYISLLATFTVFIVCSRIVICCMIAESTGRIPYILSHKNTNLDMNPDSTGPQSPILFLKMEKYTIETKYCRPV